MKTYLDRDSYRQAQSDLFEENARSMRADRWASDMLARPHEIIAGAMQQAQAFQPPVDSNSLTNPLPTLDQSAGVMAPVSSPPPAPESSVPPQPMAPPAALPAPASLPPAPTEQTAPAAGASMLDQVQPGLPPNPNGQASPFDDYFRRYAGEHANNDEFLNIVRAGTLAESGWDSNNQTGDAGHSWGLFQMHDNGAGAGMGPARLDPDAASRVMVPQYAQAYNFFKSKGLQGAQLAAAVAQAAERSADSTGSAYARAWQQLTGGGPLPSAGPSAPAPTIGGGGGAYDATPQDVAGQASPVPPGQSAASSSEPEWFNKWLSGPAASLGDYLQKLGRNPTEQELSQFLASDQQRQNDEQATGTDKPYSADAARNLLTGALGGVAESAGQGLLTSGEQERRTAAQATDTVLTPHFPEVGEAIGPIDPANPLGPVKKAAASGLTSAAAGTYNAGIPVVSGAGSMALAFGSDVLNSPTIMQHMDVLAELGKKYPNGPDTMPPTDRERWQSATIAVAGITSSGSNFDKYGVEAGFTPPGAKTPKTAPETPSNPFQLHTEPDVGRTPLSPEEAATHIDDLQQIYSANDARINELENRAFGGKQGKGDYAGELVRPVWATGWTDEALMQFARKHGFNPNDPTWGEAARDFTKESGFKGTGRPKQSPADIRAELSRLRAEQEQILAAVNHADENSAGQFYRAEPQPPEELPFDAGGYNAPRGRETTSLAAGADQGSSAGVAGNAPQGAPAPPPAGASLAPPQPQLAPNANRARALAADRAAAEQGLPTRQARLLGNDVYGGAEPPVGPGQQFTRDPQGNVVPLAEQEPTDTLRGLIEAAKARGFDTSTLEEQLRALPLLKAGRNLPPPNPNAPEMRAPRSLMLQLGEQGRQLEMPGMPKPPGGSLADKAIAVRYSSMLSSWYTHANNIASNAGQALVQPTREVVAGYPGVAGARLRGMAEGIPRGFAAAWDTLVQGAGAASKAEQVRPHAFGSGIAGRAIGVPTDMLAAVDGFFQQVAYSGSIRAQATELAGRDAARFTELMRNPTAAMVKDAEAMAKVSTYTENPGPLVDWFMRGRDTLPGPARVGLNFLFPFVRTTANILRRGAAFTVQPITGPVKTVAKLAHGDVKGARLEAADTALAGMVMMGLAGKALSGELVSEGPQSAAERKMFIAQGGQPHSIKIGSTYIPTKAFGPLGIEMEAIAAGFEGARDAKAATPTDQQVAQMAVRVKNALLEQTFLSNIADLFSDTTGGLESLAAQSASSFVPFGQAISDVTASTDPYERQPGKGLTGIGQRIEERLPGLRGNVPIEQTPLGEPLANQKQGFKALRTTEERPDPTMRLLAESGVTIPQPDDHVSLSIGQGRTLSVPITPDEQKTWQQRFGGHIRQLVQQMQNDPDWGRMPIERRAKLLQDRLQEARRRADLDAARQMGNAEVDRRVQQDRQATQRQPLSIAR